MKTFYHICLVALALALASLALPVRISAQDSDTSARIDTTSRIAPLNPEDPIPLQVLEPDTTSTSTDPVGSTPATLSVSDLGAANFSIQISVPKGINGMQPDLSLVYDSNRGNSIAGWGFSLSSQSSITFVHKDIYHDGVARGVSYDWTDPLAWDGRRLILKSGTHGVAGAVYTPEGDPYTNVFLKNNPDTDKLFFQIETVDGMRYYYGVASALHTASMNGEEHYVAWHLYKCYDRHNTQINYYYTKVNNVLYPGSIVYDDKTIAFTYETRSNDPQDFYIGSLSARMDKRLKSVTVRKTSGGGVYRTYTLNYDTTSDLSGTKYSRLTSVTESNGSGESLRPITIDWNHLPGFGLTAEEKERDAIRYFTLDDGGDFYTALDINSDGISDLIYIYSGKDISSSNNKYTFIYVYLSQINSSGGVEYSYQRKFITEPNFSVNNVKGFINGISPMDFDGDGLQDICLSNDETLGYGGNFYLYTIVTGQRILNNVIDTVPPQRQLDKHYTGKSALFTTADFDHDGKSEIFHVESGKTGNVYKGYYLFNTPSTFVDYHEFDVTLPSTPKHIFSGDFNNDGMTDIVLFCETGYKVFLNQGMAHCTCPFSDSSAYTGTDISSKLRMVQGDFNGDGLADFIMNNKESADYYLLFCNGDGSFTKSAAFQLGIADQETDRDDGKMTILALNLDHDNKTDLMVGKAIYEYHGGITPYTEYKRTEFRWFHSTGTGFELVRKTRTDEPEDARPRYLFTGDFTGNGQTELMNYGSDIWSTTMSLTMNLNGEDSLDEEVTSELDGTEQTDRSAGSDDDETDETEMTDEEGGSEETRSTSTDIFHLYTHTLMNAGKGRIRKVTDGLGNESSVSYASLVNGGIYTPDNTAHYPVNDLTVPLAVVSGYTEGNGAAGTASQSFTYGALKAEVTGRGLLGFQRRTQTDNVSGTMTEVLLQNMDTLVYVPKTVVKTTTTGSYTSTERVVSNKYAKNNNYSVLPHLLFSTDIYGNESVTEYFHDTESGITNYEEIVHDDDEYMADLESSGYESFNGVFRPVWKNRSMSHSDSYGDRCSVESSMSYNGYGELISVTENANTSLPKTTQYTYDSLGNMLTKREETGADVWLTTTYTYADNRNVASTVTSPVTSTHTYTYDTWDRPLTHTETYGDTILTVTNTYDGWGNLKTSVSPSGVRTRYFRGWGSTAAKRYYVIEWTDGHPFKKTWFDSRGREVAVESVGPDQIMDNTTTVYDSRGLVIRRQHRLGNRVSADTLSYDALGRVISERHTAGRNTIYSYGNRSTTEVTDGVTLTKQFDAFGNVKQVDENGTAVTYSYSPFSKPKEVTYGGHTVTIAYDELGNRTSLTDPDAGTSTWQYDNNGRVVRHTDGRNKVTTRTYDALGNKRTETVDGETSSFYYDRPGRNLRRVYKSGYYKLFYYDLFQRLKRTVSYVSGMNSLYRYYTYDQYDRILNDSTVNAASVTNRYDLFGYKTSSSVNGKTIYRMDEFTGSKEVVRTLGDSITILRRYDNAERLTSQSVRVRDSYGFLLLPNDTTAYMYDNATSNLIQEIWNGGFNNYENRIYTYDSLDRLTRRESRNFSGAVTSSCDISYNNYGNITGKTGIGQYTYGSVKPHAVRSVGNTDSLIPLTTQEVTYNATGKVSRIVEDGLRLDLYYDTEGQRCRSVWRDTPTHISKTIRYYDNLDMITADGVSTMIQYLDGGVVYIKEKNADQSTACLYHAVTDRLGSYTKVLKGNGTAVFKASYDEWGKQTVTTNTIGFFRGYTGHEMLPEFGLINMNGRMYDPLLARFLSPDDYMQMPMSPQGFNRYSYCMNNPMRYTDPSGELFEISTIIGAIIGTYMGGVLANGTYNPVKWDFNSANTWGYMFCGGMVGAASGYLGGAISASGTVGANTAGILASSAVNSIGTYAYTLGKTSISVSAGAVSYDFTNEELGYLGKRGNKKLTKIGYFLGAMANLHDINNIFNATTANLYTQTTEGDQFDPISHTAIVSKDNEILMSYGPNDDKIPNSLLGFAFKLRKSTSLYNPHIGEGFVSDEMLLNSNLFSAVRSFSEIFPYQGISSNCVNWASLGLWLNGIPNIGIHPFLLHGSIVVYNSGIYNLIASQLFQK